MASISNLDPYFHRIHFNGERQPTLETLQQLQRLHTQTIPFENLNSFLGLPVKLELVSLLKKLVHQGRGGYCFEQNLVFKHVLETLGFSVTGLAARVLWNQPQDQITRRSHMLLLVEHLGETYIVDVGFGALTPTAPLLLELNKIQQTSHEPFRILKPEDGYYFLQALVQKEWKTLYRFDLHREYMPDYEMANWYLSHHPESHFVTNLIASRPGIERRYTLNNTEFKTYYLNGKTERKTLATKDELKNVLATVFRLNLDLLADLDDALENLISTDLKN